MIICYTVQKVGKTPQKTVSLPERKKVVMGQTVLLNGMVLSVMPIGDYDKRLVVLTSERGKITAFARGARRPNSPLLAAANPFVFGEFELFEGKTSYNICKVSVKNYFRELTGDLDAVYYGFYFLELADACAVENVEAKEFCNLLYLSLQALKKPVFPNRLVRRVYELRILVQAGEYPSLFQCVSCGKKETLHTFSIRRGGMLCEQCAARHGSGIELDASTLYAMQYIVSVPLEELYRFQVTEEVLGRLETVVGLCMENYTDRTFHSLEFLNR